MKIYGRVLGNNEAEYPDVSAVTYRVLNKSGVVTERIPDSPYFVQYESSMAHTITRAMREAWREFARSIGQTEDEEFELIEELQNIDIDLEDVDSYIDELMNDEIEAIEED